MEACVTALKRYAGDDTRVKYLRHQSYLQGISQLEQEAEKGIPYSNLWSASYLKRGYNMMGPNYRYHKSAKPVVEKNPMSLQHQHSDAGIDSSSTGGEIRTFFTATQCGLSGLCGWCCCCNVIVKAAISR